MVHVETETADRGSDNDKGECNSPSALDSSSLTKPVVSLIFQDQERTKEIGAYELAVYPYVCRWGNSIQGDFRCGCRFTLENIKECHQYVCVLYQG